MADPGQRSAYEVLHVREDAPQVVLEAAFRALASLYHPDRNPSTAASHQMAELNRAYALVRTRELRQAYDRLRPSLAPPSQPVTVSAPSPPRAASDVLDFGRYAGWSLRDLARHDPDYLRWLSRHTSGIRHRRRILELLATPAQPSASERLRGR